MLNELISFSRNQTLDFIIKLLISVVMMCLLGPVVVLPEGEIPITLQTFAILFSAIAFGWQIGGLATILYIILGAYGLPVFASGASGPQVLTGPSGGFFFGFIFASVVCGYLATLDAFRGSLAAILVWIIGHLLILVAGFVWLASFSDTWADLIKKLAVGGIVKSMLGALVIEMIRRFMRGRVSGRRAFED